MKTNYSVQELWRIFTRNILIIALIGIVTGGASYFYFHSHQKTTYTAQRSILIDHAGSISNVDKITKEDILKMNTYAQIMNDPIVTDKVYSEMKDTKDFKDSRQKVSSKIDVATGTDSLILSISASGETRKSAIKLANVTAETAAKALPTYVKHDGEIRLLADAKNRKVETTVTPHVRKLTVYGLAAGLVLGAIIVFGIDLLKNQRKQK